MGGSNPPQTLSGIETCPNWVQSRIAYRSNPPQTLSGIETLQVLDQVLLTDAPTHPKPSQGLKQESPE